MEHLRELSEKYKAQVHVPFHSLNHEDDEELPQSILDKADHDLVGELADISSVRHSRAVS